MFFLKIMTGNLAGQKYELDCERVTIGRSTTNSIVLDDAAVSGNHSILQREGNAWFLRDLNSTNGTYVNDTRITNARLVSGDTIRLGEIKLLFGEQPEANINASPQNSGTIPEHVPTISRPISTAVVPPIEGFKVKRNLKPLWIVLIIIVAISVLAAGGYFIFRILRASNP